MNDKHKIILYVNDKQYTFLRSLSLLKQKPMTQIIRDMIEERRRTKI